MQVPFRLQVTPWRGAGLEPVNLLQIRGTAQPLQSISQVRRLSQEDDGITIIFEPLCRDVFRPLDQPGHRHGWSRVNRAVRALVVQANIPARYRRIKGAASLGQAPYRLAKLPKNFRLQRVPEV